MRIKYIGHSYHQKTNSTSFFIELLRSMGELSLVWDDSWTGKSAPADLSDCHDYDMVVAFQVEEIARRGARMGLRNLVFCPMWDESFRTPGTRWEALSEVKILHFSSTLHERVQGFGHRRGAYFQYYLDPARHPQVTDFSTVRPFFWQRRPMPSWREVGRLLGDTPLAGMTLHTALDPHPDNEGKGAVLPDPAYMARHQVEVTTWFPRREDLTGKLAAANLYFAPREDEGIGMSFLEAMAMGMPVVAHDAPTMNEYIVDGVNGFLYTADDLRPLALGKGRLAELGKRAAESAALGHRRWLADRQRMFDFLTTPAAKLGSVRLGFSAAPPEDGEACAAPPWLSVVALAGATTTAGWTHPGVEVIHVAPGQPLPAIRGEWVCFPDEGIAPCDPAALRELLADVPADAEFALGGQVSVDATGRETFHRPCETDTIRRYLDTGRLPRRLHGKDPLPHTPFIRAQVLARAPWDTSAALRDASLDWMLGRIGQGASAHALNAFVLARTEPARPPKPELRRLLGLLSVHARHVPGGQGAAFFKQARDAHLHRHLPVLGSAHPQLADYLDTQAHEAQVRAECSEARAKWEATSRRHAGVTLWLRTRSWKHFLRKRAAEKRLRALKPVGDTTKLDQLIWDIAGNEPAAG